MKWVLFLIFLCSVKPLASWIRKNPTKHPVVWTVLGFLVIQHSPLHLFFALISWAAWPGYVKGVELSVVDFLAFAMYLALPRATKSFSFKAVAIFYLLAVLASVFDAEFTQPVLFYAWQTTRVLFIAFVVSRGVANDKNTTLALLRGMAYGIILALGSAALDRFAHGDLQAKGEFAHQNTLGLLSHFLTFPFLAIWLAGGTGWLPIIIPIAGAMIAILTVSRATIALVGMGCVFVFFCSALRGWSSRKTKVALMGIAAAVILIPLAMSSLQERLGSASVLGEDQEREAFERAAAMMLEDHPWGVGANYYVVVANEEGYSDRAGVIPTLGSRGANVHNVYSLVLAETGYIGFAAFLLLLAQPLLMSFRTAWVHSQDRRGDVLLGLGVALLVVYIHSLVEWTFLTFQVQYPFGVTIGLIAGLAQQLGRVPGDGVGGR
jgi:O-antigen ligase